MSNCEFCCNPFKQRNHKPESWRLLPVTESLREQFNLYLGDDTYICISCKRQLYRTLPSMNAKKPRCEHNDSVMQEIEEMGFWSDELEITTPSFHKSADELSSDEDLLASQLTEMPKNVHRTGHQRATGANSASKVAVLSSSAKIKESARSTHPTIANVQ